MSQATRRPLIVWIIGVLLLLAAVLRTAVFTFSCVRYSEYMHAAPFQTLVLPLAVLGALWSIGLGLLRRWRWARWAAVLLIGTWAVFTLVRMPSHFDAGPAADALDVAVSDADYQQSRRISLYVAVAIGGVLAMTLALHPKVGRYFQAVDTAEKRDDQPCQGEEGTDPLLSMTCPSCGEGVPETFATCWNCQTDLHSNKMDASDSQTRA